MAKKYPKKPPVPIGEVLQQLCNHCDATGQEPGLADLTCRECFGRGRRKWRIEECEACRGKGKTGFLNLGKCSECKGKGWKARDIG